MIKMTASDSTAGVGGSNGCPIITTQYIRNKFALEKYVYCIICNKGK